MKRSFKKLKERQRPKTATTRDAILRAAVRILARDGFPALSARSIAREAGTNLALLNYHFGSKQRLLLAIYDVLDADRLERQQRLYADATAPLSVKWRRAVEYYRADLADGYIRVLKELSAHGYSNAVIGRRVRGRMRGWLRLLEGVARTALPKLGVDLDPELVVSALGSFWQGMDERILLGETEAQGRFFAILDEIGNWIETQERQANMGGRKNARARAG
jgi:AcrR family transcriptional regulator